MTTDPLKRSFKAEDFFNTLDELTKTCNEKEVVGFKFSSVDLAKVKSQDGTVTDATVIIWNSVPLQSGLGNLIIQTYASDISSTDKNAKIAIAVAKGHTLVYDGAAFIKKNRTKLLVFRPS